MSRRVPPSMEEKHLNDPEAGSNGDEKVEAAIAFARLRTKVIQRWHGTVWRRRLIGSSSRYLRTVRGDT